MKSYRSKNASLFCLYFSVLALLLCIPADFKVGLLPFGIFASASILALAISEHGRSEE